MTHERALRTRDVVRFWLPLAATWLMMSVEGPYVAAIIARMPGATLNLAAYGVAFTLAWLGESPIIMLLTASNRLVHDHQSFIAVRRFMYTMIAGLTALMALATLPPVFRFFTAQIMGLPADVTALLRAAMVILIPWPAAIGYRRFFQGILVRHGHPHRVAYGTTIRLTSMSVTAAALAFWTPLHGVTVGAYALVAGVTSEAAASRWMARHVVTDLLAGPATPSASGSSPLTQRSIVRFYYPLALTSMISMVTGPMLTFFMARSRSPIESLAALPIVQNLVFSFRSGGVAFQEVGVALSGRHGEHEREVGRAAMLLAAASSLALAALVLTPLANVWFQDIAGLSPLLAGFARLPAQLLVLLPATEYLIAFQRSRVILNGETRIVTAAMAVEVSGIALVLWLCIARFGMIGIVAGSVALMCGRLAANLCLFATSRPSHRGSDRRLTAA